MGTAGKEWIIAEWFRSLPGREIYCSIPLEFVRDEFNLVDLPPTPVADELLGILVCDFDDEDGMVTYL